jgi:hypothetical protein
MSGVPRPDPIIPLVPGSYAFNERAEIRVAGQGEQTTVWVGLSAGLCLGTLDGPGIRTLVSEITRRLGLKNLAPRLQRSPMEAR